MRLVTKILLTLCLTLTACERLPLGAISSTGDLASEFSGGESPQISFDDESDGSELGAPIDDFSVSPTEGPVRTTNNGAGYGGGGDLPLAVVCHAIPGTPSSIVGPFVRSTLDTQRYFASAYVTLNGARVAIRPFWVTKTETALSLAFRSDGFDLTLNLDAKLADANQYLASLQMTVSGQTFNEQRFCQIVEAEDPSAAQISLPEAPATQASSAGYKRLWPGGKVYYSLSASLPNPERVQWAMREVYSKTGIQFIAVDESDPNRPNDYLRILRTPKPDGSGSFFGRVGGVQPLVLADDAPLRTTIHELGHALGMIHPLSRTIFQNLHFRIFWQNILPGHRNEFNFSAAGGTNLADLGPQGSDLDLETVMLYDQFAFSTGKPTYLLRNDPEWTSSSIPVQLSVGDQKTLSDKYAASLGCSDARAYAYYQRPTTSTPALHFLYARAGAQEGEHLKGGDVQVMLTPSDRPIVLALASVTPTTWKFHALLSPARIEKIIILGNPAQKVEGVAAGIESAPALSQCLDVNGRWKITFDPDNQAACGIDEIVQQAREITGRQVTQFQACNSEGGRFLVPRNSWVDVDGLSGKINPDSPFSEAP